MVKLLGTFMYLFIFTPFRKNYLTTTWKSINQYFFTYFRRCLYTPGCYSERTERGEGL